MAGGGPLEAYERLSVITVAAGVRGFAFLTLIEAQVQSLVVQLLEEAGLSARPCSSSFDIDFEVDGVSAATVQMYRQVIRERDDPLAGLGIWLPNSPLSCADMSSLGSALGYPDCCHLNYAQSSVVVGE
jgi:hypothetical protein